MVFGSRKPLVGQHKSFSALVVQYVSNVLARLLFNMFLMFFFCFALLFNMFLMFWQDCWPAAANFGGNGGLVQLLHT